MKNHSLAAKMFKRFKRTTRQSEKPFFVAPDLLQQNFTAYEPNEAWVSDITYKGLGLLCHDPGFVFSKDCRLGY
jgi:transposase InsO family protein